MDLFLVVVMGAFAALLALILAFQSSNNTAPASSNPHIATFISIAALIATAANSYFTFFWHNDSLRLYLRFKDPSQLGTSQLDLAYFFSNIGNRPILVENIGIFVLKSNAAASADDNAPLNACTKYSFLSNFVRSHSLEALQDEGVEMRAGDGVYIIVHNPIKSYIDGIAMEFGSASIEAGKARSFIAAFNTVPSKWDQLDTVVICPFINFFDGRGQPITAVCKGVVKTTYKTGVSSIRWPPNFLPIQLLPLVSEDGFCLTTPAYLNKV